VVIKQPVYNLQQAREYQKCGLLMYDNNCRKEYSVAGLVRWIPQTVEHGRFYIMLEE